MKVWTTYSAESGLAVEVSVTSSSGPNTSGGPCVVDVDVSRLSSVEPEASSSRVSRSKNSRPDGEWTLVVDGDGAGLDGNCQKHDGEGELDEGHY